MNNNQKWIIGGLVGLVAVCLCLGVFCVTAGGLAALGIPIRRSITQGNPGNFVTQVATEVIVPEFASPTAATTTGTEDATVEPTVEGTLSGTPESTLSAASPTTAAATPAAGAGVSQGAQETINTLEKSVVPINDPRDLAGRLSGIKDIPATMTPPKEALQVGATQTFWASNVDNNQNFQVNAHLRYVTSHLYFWVQDGVDYDQQALQRLCDTFEKKIYPTDRNFFGSEWSPGIDGDAHLYVLFARGLGGGIAGYFSSADELPPQAHKYSNAHEMFFLSADNGNLADPYIYGVMAHEFQHMIHWFGDRNEESWMNEGFSVVAEFLNGYDIGGFDTLFASDPDLQLTYWPSPPESTPHYGESFLFLDYFLDRFGDKATQALVANPDNGMDSVDKVLASLSEKDPRTGKTITADDLFADWAVATYVNNPKAGDGRYTYKNYPDAPKPRVAEEVNNCTPDAQKRTVHQYGVDYIKINCSGDYTLQFKGSPEVNVLPVNAFSGNYAFWSNKGDESDMSLTRTFDFSQASGPLTLKYHTWYDLEKDYDYTYLEVSEDGSSWQILKTPSGRDKSLDPSGNSYGWGYNDKSNDWIEESVDLSQYAGKKVQIRFEYVTDAAVNNDGFLVDNIQIPQINYSEDFEKGDGGWQGNGFVRIQNRLPQNFRIALVEEGQTVSVQNITLDGSGTANIPLHLSGSLRNAVLVVSGITRFTTQQANYEFSFQK